MSLAKLARRFLLVISLAGACSSPSPENYSQQDAKNARSVFIVHDAWHAAIVIKRADLAAAMFPELRDFPTSEYLEFSWGDRDYFPAPDAGFGMALKAAFWSSGSILHVVGFSESVEVAYPNAQILKIYLPEKAFQGLVDFISDTFSRPHPPAPAEARPGLFANGKFYAAQGDFSLLRTCNTWVAEAFKAAGFPVSPRYAVTANNLDNQLRPFAAAQ